MKDSINFQDVSIRGPLLNSVTIQGEVKWWKISLTTRVE